MKRNLTLLIGIITILSLTLWFINRKALENILPTSKIELDTATSVLAIDFQNFDSEKKENHGSISSKKAFSGTQSSELNNEIEFSLGIQKNLKELKAKGKIKTIDVSARIWAEKFDQIMEAVIVLAISDSIGTSYYWEGIPLSLSNVKKWEIFNHKISLNLDTFPENSLMNIYVWNKQKKNFFVDDLEVIYNGFAVTNNTINYTDEKLNQNYFYDLENTKDLEGSESIGKGESHSGNFSCHLNSNFEYSVTINKKVKEVVQEPLKNIWASVWLKPMEADANAMLVVSITDASGKQIHWDGKSIENKPFPTNQWTKLNAGFKIPFEKINNDDIISIYVWNKNKSKIFVDDFEIVYGDNPSKKGNETKIDMMRFNDEGYKPQRNQPPFPTSYFIKEEIKNNDSQFLVSEVESRYGDLDPNSLILTGNFIEGNSSKVDIISINNTRLELFTSCSKDNSYKLFYKKDLSPSEVDWCNQQIMVADFNNDNSDELFIFNSNKNQAELLFFKKNSFDKCNNTPTSENLNTEIIWQSKDDYLGNMALTKDSKLVTGDFNGDNKTDLFITNQKNGNWSVNTFSNNSWTQVNGSFGSNPKNLLSPIFSVVSGKFLKNLNKDLLLTLRKINNNWKYEIMEISGNSINIILENNEGLKGDDELLVGNYDLDPEDEIIQITRNWRFEMYFLNFDNNGLLITSQVDFKGYPNDHNPKYYEVNKFIPLKTYKENKLATSLLVVLKNCLLSNYSGGNCEQYENLSILPNHILLFTPEMILKKNTDL